MTRTTATEAQIAHITHAGLPICAEFALQLASRPCPREWSADIKTRMNERDVDDAGAAQLVTASRRGDFR